MRKIERDVQSLIGDSLDAVQAFLGIAAIVFTTAALADHVLGSPLGSGVLALTGVVAAAGTVAFVTFDASPARLGAFIAYAILAALGWLILVAGGMQLVGMTIEAGDRQPFLYAWFLALATSHALVYSRAIDFQDTISSPTQDGTSS